MILADTKFEFGTDAAGKLFLIDEVLTPDSSRYWPADEYRTGSRRRATTSSSCATTSSPQVEPDPARPRACPPR
jgi:phosphoribosylaminoimidazole-succinocarboxamide synthase